MIHGSIYDWPKYYEFIYGSDWQAECEFLQWSFERFVSGPVTRLFEPACGTGRLIYRLAQQGYQVGGIDLNPAAVDYCLRRLQKRGLQADVWVADMCDFQVQTPWDAAFNTINSFRHLESDQQARQHLNCMAQAIRPGGIYVLGFHLTPTGCEPDEEESWVHRRGHLQINASMWLVERNTAQRSETHALSFDIYTPTRQFRIQDEFRFRTYTVDQFLSLIEEIPAFRIVETYDFAYEQPIQLDGQTQDAVFVLQREPSPPCGEGA